MGRKRKKLQTQGKRKEKLSYDDIVKENKKYENYYKEQNCFDMSQFDDFINTIKLPLPAVFRISGYKKHSKQLLQNMKKFHFAELRNVKVDDEIIQPPSALPWYPDELAWRTNFNRTQIRRAPELQKFHAFLIAENESGHITRQEAVSMIPPLLLDVKPHHKVLDMCAAPGSKTAQLIELIHQEDKQAIPDGLCIANDKDNKRCYMLVHQMNRLGSPATIVVNHDASTFPELYIKDSDGQSKHLRYDRVLCDVPCSGDGTIRKNNDIWVKWDVCNSLYLHGIQLRILMRGLELLAPGGLLVYSTCSLNPIEDEAVVAAALSKCEGAVELVQADLPRLKWSPGVSSWKVMDRSQTWYEKHSDLPQESNISTTMFPPEEVDKMHMEKCMRLLPHLQDTGGFFVAILRKQSKLSWQKNDVVATSNEQGEEVAEAAKPPPRKRVRWIRGFKEDPFVFFTQTDIDNTFPAIRDFYGLENFPTKQLLTRTHQERKKNIYFVNEIAKNVVENNLDCLKIINTGIRVFSRADNSQHNLKCGFRLVQAGLECIEPFVTRQRIDISLDDVITLLVDEQPLYSDLSQELRDQLQGIDPGSVVYRHSPADESAAVSCDLLMCGWKGYVATRVYLCKNERMHYLNLCGHPVPDRLMPNSRRGKPAEDSIETLAATENLSATNGDATFENDIQIKDDSVTSNSNQTSAEPQLDVSNDALQTHLPDNDTPIKIEGDIQKPTVIEIDRNCDVENAVSVDESVVMKVLEAGSSPLSESSKKLNAIKTDSQEVNKDPLQIEKQKSVDTLNTVVGDQTAS